MNLLITGISGFLGQALVQALVDENPFGRILGLDRHVPEMLGPVNFLAADLLAVDLSDLLVMNEIEVIIHLASASEKDERGAHLAMLEKLLKSAEMAGVRRIVVPSTDRIYEPAESPCLETDPLRKLAGLMSFDERLHEDRRCEDALAAFGHPQGMEIVIPRLATVIGLRGQRPIDGVLGSKRLFVRKDQQTQGIHFIHLSDASSALIRSACASGLNGVYNLAGEEPLSMETVAGILQARLVFLPGGVFEVVLKVLDVFGLLPCRPIEFLRLWQGTPVSTRKAEQALGPMRLSSRQALAFWRVGTGNRVP